MFLTSVVHLQESSYAVCCDLVCLNVMNKINHRTLCILLDYIYIAKWYTVHTISCSGSFPSRNANQPASQLNQPTKNKDLCPRYFTPLLRTKRMNWIWKRFPINFNMDWDYANGSDILAKGVCVYMLTTADVLLLLLLLVEEGSHLAIRSSWRKTLFLEVCLGG